MTMMRKLLYPARPSHPRLEQWKQRRTLYNKEMHLKLTLNKKSPYNLMVILLTMTRLWHKQSQATAMNPDFTVEKIEINQTAQVE